MAVNQHAQLVWSKELKTEPGKKYHVRLYDSVNGQCVLSADNKTGKQIEELVAWHKAANYNVKAFAYPMDGEYISKSRPTTVAVQKPRARKK
jgi:hypothetical protein